MLTSLTPLPSWSQLVYLCVVLCCFSIVRLAQAVHSAALTRNGVSFSSASINYKECQLNIIGSYGIRIGYYWIILDLYCLYAKLLLFGDLTPDTTCLTFQEGSEQAGEEHG